MIKEWLKYLLPLCILLVDGVSNMYAGSQERQACMSPVHLLARSEHPNFVQVFDDANPAFRLPDATRKFESFVKTISEEKEEDSSESSYSLKRQLRTGAIPVVPTALHISPISHSMQKSQDLWTFQTTSSSPLYLRLRVLRI